jgi:hypothetical protein
MKTLILLLLSSFTLIIYNVNSTEEKKDNIDVEAIISKSQKNFEKAKNITKLADQQQKAKMVEMHEKVEKLEEEKVMLQENLIKTQNELQVVKTIINNPTDTGEQFNLFPEN